jgi:hypothetical protein
MWILHSLAHGLLPVPVASTALLRLGFGAAFVWKFGWDARWGGLHYFDKGTFVRWRYERLKRHAKLLLSPLAYKWFYVSRLVAAVLVMAGIEASAVAALVALWCAFEFTFDRKFHTQFLFVCAACLGVDGQRFRVVPNGYDESGAAYSARRRSRLHVLGQRAVQAAVTAVHAR